MLWRRAVLGTVRGFICLSRRLMAKLHPSDRTIRVVAFPRGGLWVAQCLEVDVCAQASSKEALEAELLDILKTHVAMSKELGQQPFHNMPQAPAVFFEMFDNSQKRAAEIRPASASSMRAGGVVTRQLTAPSGQLDIAFAC